MQEPAWICPSRLTGHIILRLTGPVSQDFTAYPTNWQIIDKNPVTGTAAGDPIEAEAISRVLFGPDIQTSHGTQPLYVGSIKTVLGHSEGTAGVAGVLKASLALQHGVIPPNLLLSELSPTVKPFYNHLQILQEARDWPAVPEGPRRASVNSFGFGGTNAHAILEQFMPATPERQDLYAKTTPMSPFNFSAASEKSLQATLTAYAAFISSPSFSMCVRSVMLRR